jgi:hypothetical protein
MTTEGLISVIIVYNVIEYTETKLSREREPESKDLSMSPSRSVTLPALLKRAKPAPTFPSLAAQA